MAKFQLKDKKLQEKLDEISEGRLSRVLACQIDAHPVEAIDERTSRITFSFPRGTIKLFLPNEDIETVEQYNPNLWNRFPNVRPPAGVWMRTEFVNKHNGRVIRDVARYEQFEGNWYWFNDDDIDIDVDRFRPWED